ncbi:unnamed protein product [Rodentolepis nana]|uniref:SAM domain-containing protein n=1 Tax=Rodentolepis nana TaxID=102285 RepID=A0A0R3TSX0_RODNA|nr:unnamed protein product [Rodentolepis nana]
MEFSSALTIVGMLLVSLFVQTNTFPISEPQFTTGQSLNEALPEALNEENQVCPHCLQHHYREHDGDLDDENAYAKYSYQPRYYHDDDSIDDDHQNPHHSLPYDWPARYQSNAHQIFYQCPLHHQQQQQYKGDHKVSFEELGHDVTKIAQFLTAEGPQGLETLLEANNSGDHEFIPSIRQEDLVALGAAISRMDCATRRSFARKVPKAMSKVWQACPRCWDYECGVEY